MLMRAHNDEKRKTPVEDNSVSVFPWKGGVTPRQVTNAVVKLIKEIMISTGANMLFHLNLDQSKRSITCPSPQPVSKIIGNVM